MVDRCVPRPHGTVMAYLHGASMDSVAELLSSCSLNWYLPPHLNMTQDGANRLKSWVWPWEDHRLHGLKILGDLSPAREGTVLVVGGTALVFI